MGKLQVFEITFDPSHAVFIAGTVVRGSVRLDLRGPMKMRGENYLHGFNFQIACLFF